MDFWAHVSSPAQSAETLAVIPVLAPTAWGLIALLPGILAAVGGVIVGLMKWSTVKRLGLLLWSQKFVVLGIAAAVWGLIYLQSVLFPASVAAVAQLDAGSAASGWPVWRGSPERRGYAPGFQDPTQGKIVWAFSRDGIMTFYASPAVVGNRLYITSALLAPFRNKGAIYSIEADSGELVWSFSASKYRATFSSPAISGKYLVVGEGLHYTSDARVFCIDIPASEKRREGVKLWEYRTKSHVESSPCIADGKVFIGAGDDGLYCFDLEPDANGEAKILWHLDGKKYPDCETAPVYHEGRVYFGLGIGGQAVCCVSVKDGSELWRIPTPYPAFGSPTVVAGPGSNGGAAATAGKPSTAGKLYAAMGWGDYVNTADKVRGLTRAKLESAGKSPEEAEAATRDIKAAGAVWCVDLATHQVDWKFALPETVLGSVAVDGDRLYFGCRDGKLYCLSAKGERLAAWDAHEPIVTAPAVGAEHVYVTTSSGSRGQLYGVSKKDMALAWDVALNSATFSSPVVARGHVYVGTTDNGLLCVGEPSSEKPKPLWAGALGGAGKSGWFDGSLVAARGEYAWGFTDTPEPTDDAAEVAVPAIYTPAAYVPGTDSDGQGAFYIGINHKDACGLAKLTCGKSLDDKPARSWFAATKNPIYLSAAATAEAVFFVDGRAGDTGRELHCLEPETGAEKWRLPVADGASGEFAITLQRLVIADRPGGLACLDIAAPEAEKKLWAEEVGPCVGPPAIVGGVVIVAVGSPPLVAALDLDCGAKLWQRALASAPRTGPVFVADRVWVGLAGSLAGYNLFGDDVRTDDVRTVDCGPVVGRLVSGGNVLACVNEAGEVVLVPAEDGNKMVRLPGVQGGIPPLVTDNGLLYVTQNAVQRYDLGTRESTQWMRIRASWPGAVVSPMIMVDSHLFLATDKKGFVCLKPTRD